MSQQVDLEELSRLHEEYRGFPDAGMTRINFVTALTAAFPAIRDEMLELRERVSLKSIGREEAKRMRKYLERLHTENEKLREQQASVDAMLIALKEGEVHKQLNGAKELLERWEMHIFKNTDDSMFARAELIQSTTTFLASLAGTEKRPIDFTDTTTEYRINVSWTPDNEYTPEWQVLTKEQFLREWGIWEDEWMEMVEAGAVQHLPTKPQPPEQPTQGEVAHRYFHHKTGGALWEVRQEECPCQKTDFVWVSEDPSKRFRAEDGWEEVTRNDFNELNENRFTTPPQEVEGGAQP